MKKYVYMYIIWIKIKARWHTWSWAEPDQSQAGGRVQAYVRSCLLHYITLPDSSYEYYYFEVGVTNLTA